MAKLKLEVIKGKEKKNGMFIWGIWVVAPSGRKLPAGTVEARTKAVAKRKGLAYVRKNFKGMGQRV